MGTHTNKNHWELFMRLIASALILAFALTPSLALAGQCQVDLAKIDAALAKAKLDKDMKQEVTDLKDQAAKLCGAGNEQQGLDVTAQAKQILNID